MSRPKGIIQKRDESKYTLPTGVELIDTAVRYNKETVLLFNDVAYGEFQSCFKALQHANASTHPEAVKARRSQTNLSKYGVANVSESPEVRAKAKQTMKERYGVEYALLKEEFAVKSKQTLRSNHNVSNPMHSKEIKNKQKLSVIRKYNVDNVLKCKEIQDQIKKTNLVRYGHENASKSPEVVEKILKYITENSGNYSSKGENSVRSFIEHELKVSTETGYIGGASPKQLDIIIKDKNIAIEYNGSYWHSEANPHMYKNYHLDKMNSCSNKELKLIQIFDFEWDNRKEQVKSFLRSSLGCNEIKLNARDLEIVQLNKTESDEFLNRFHILGTTRHIKAYGFKLNGEIQALVTVGKHHRNNTEIVLSRYCGRENVTIRGGLSKLTKAILNEYPVISTWIDLRYSDGKSWIDSGWELINRLPPDYFYYNIKTNKIVSKQSRKKNKVNTPSDITEHEHALKDGLVRIYDCGKLKLNKSIKIIKE
jgi:hypothetical protein